MRKFLSLLLSLAVATGALAQTKPPVLPAWASTATPTTDIVQPSNAYIQQGWPLSSTPPSRQYFNWLDNYEFNAIRYFSRRGVVEWDSAETYPVGAVVQQANVLYSSNVASNIGNTPTSGSTQWVPIATKTAPLGNNSSLVASTEFVHNNYIPIGATFSSIAGQIQNAQVPLFAVSQWQSSLSIGYGQLTGVPASTAAQPNNICVRDSAGDGFFRYVNLGQANNENPVQGTLQVVVTNGVDNYTRKSSLANLESLMNLGALGGQVSAGQVPQAAVTQYDAAIFAYNPLVAKSVNGYTQIPGGIIEQWGTITVTNNTNNVIDVPFTFPTQFPNAAFFVTAVTDRRVAVNGQAVNASGHCTLLTRASVVCTADSSGGGVSTFRWFAVGY